MNMSVFVLSSKFLVISDRSNDLSRLIIYDLTTDKQLNSIDWPQQHIALTKPQNKQKLDSQIVCACFSVNSELFAATDDNKQLIIWSINNLSNEWSIIKRHKLERNSIKILFSRNGEQLISGDKSGNVYSYGVNSVTTEPNCGQLLLGHCSMLLDLELNGSSKYLATCDRDEKIRVSYYPNCYNIESYCLGHNEFVSTIAWISDHTLISGSGDESMRLWNAINGEQLKIIEFSRDTTDKQNKFAVKKLVTNQLTDPKFIAICFYNKPLVSIYELNCELEFKHIHTIDSLDNQPIDLHFDAIKHNLLWILLPINDNPLKIYEINAQTVNMSHEFYPNILELVNSNANFKNSLSLLNNREVDGLYKHWFNNVDIYMQKKNERLKVNKKAKVV